MTDDDTTLGDDLREVIDSCDGGVFAGWEIKLLLEPTIARADALAAALRAEREEHGSALDGERWASECLQAERNSHQDTAVLLDGWKARAERAEAERDAVALTAERMTSYARQFETEVDTLRAERDRLAAHMGDVRAMHSKRWEDDDGWWGETPDGDDIEGPGYICSKCTVETPYGMSYAAWPCRTIAALDA